MKPFISVIMPVRNEAEFMGETINQILRQDYPRNMFEILIVDGLSTDKTLELAIKILKENKNIKIFKNLKKLSGAGRNIGFKNARGEILVVIDGHCFIENDQLFNNIVRCFDISGAQCLGRPQFLNPPGINIFQKSVALARASRIGHGGDSLIYSDYEGFASPISNGAVYKRNVFSQVGLVDEHFDACEDLEFNYRVEKNGIPAYTSPLIGVKYYPRKSLKGLFRQMFRYGKGRFKYIKKHPEAMSVNTLVPGIFVTGIICWLISLVVLSLLGKIISALYIAYLILIFSESLMISIKNGFKYLAYLPQIFLTIHLGLGAGFLTALFEEIYEQILIYEKNSLYHR